MDHGNSGPYAVAREIGPAEVIVPPHLEDLPEVRVELAQYWNSVQRLDLAIGEIVKALEASGAGEDTAIIFSSHHGMPFPFAKAACYDHGTRVPVLLIWPGIEAPRRFETLATSVDILPTLLDLLGAPAPPQLDGRSWLPLIRGEAGRAARISVHLCEPGVERHGVSDAGRSGRALRAVVLGLTFPAMQKAAVINPAIASRGQQFVKGRPLALYDLKEDPGQRTNPIDSARHQRRVEKMKAALLAEMRRTEDPQLRNFEIFLAGGRPVVPQDPARYRPRDGE